MDFKIPNFKIESITDKLPVWSILTFIILFVGFIGFYTYCALNNIPFLKPDIQVIVGIGIYNAIFWFLIYLSNLADYQNKSWKALVIIGILNILISDPLIIVGSILVFITIFSRGYWEIFIGIKSEKNQKVNQIKNEKRGSTKISWDENRSTILVDGLGVVVAALIGLFNSSSFFIIFSVIFAISFDVERILKTRTINAYSLLVVLVLTPIFITAYLINDKQYSLIGLSKTYMTIETNDSESIEGIMVYKGNNYLYYKSDPKNHTTYAITNSEIKRIKLNRKKIKSNDKGIIKNLSRSRKKSKKVIPPQRPVMGPDTTNTTEK